ncbi:MAG: SixA phosphatase family protein [Acidimicrobiales bacterium]
MTLYVVRHGQAVPRQAWAHDDAQRPLSEAGMAQAAGLLERFAGRTVGLLVASPTLRCLATLLPLANERTLDLRSARQLLPGAASAAAELARELLGADAVLCTHREVIPDLLWRLGAADLEGTTDELPTGGVWAVDGDAGRLAVAYLPPPELDHLGRSRPERPPHTGVHLGGGGR